MFFFPRDKFECRLRYGLDLKRPLIVSAGALVERKGHHHIIQALKYLSDRRIDAQLLIVGGPGPEGQYEAKLHELVSDLNLQTSVHFTGKLAPDAMGEALSAGDLLCLASTNEGWPNVVHEALACGSPVVSTDVSAVPDMLPQRKFQADCADERPSGTPRTGPRGRITKGLGPERDFGLGPLPLLAAGGH